jgi:omega-6 fatty acid desaturase (delta-12 desaturase)
MLTVAEYQHRSRRERVAYRLFRNPVVMFGLGPLFAMVLSPRIVSREARPALRHSVHATNVALAILVAGLCWLIGWRSYLLIQGPSALLAGAAGIWLFYVQHQFEDTYWERGGQWTYPDAALRGSSYLRLPQPLQWFSGNIGLHHVHHLNARIPNYNLQRAHNANAIFHDIPVVSLWSGVRAVRLKLWDEDRARLVTFAEARSSRVSAAGAPAATTAS